MHVLTLLVGAIFLLIALPMATAGVLLWLQDNREQRQLEAEGHMAGGVVLSKSIHVDRTSGSGASFQITYRFAPAHGQPIAGTARIERAQWLRLQPGDGVEVNYLPAAPSTHRVEGQLAELLLPGLLLAVGGVLMLPGLVLAWLAIRRRPSSRSPPPLILGGIPRWGVLLFAAVWLVVGVPLAFAGAYQMIVRNAEDAAFEVDGQLAQGVVLTKAIETERRRSSSGTGRRTTTTRHHRVTYRYQTLDGNVVVGKSNVDPEVWDRLEERGSIAVTYLPQRPWLHRLDGESGRWGFRVMLGLGLLSTAIGGVALVAGLRGRRASGRGRPSGARAAGTRVVAADVRDPDEHVRAPVTDVKNPARRGWVISAVGGIFLMVGVALVGSGIEQWNEERRYAESGAIIEGHVVGKAIDRAGGDNDSTRYLATYRFVTVEGEAFEGDYELAVDAWEALEDGGPVSVRYLPGEPQRHRAASESATGDIVAAFILGPLCAGLGGVLLYFMFRRKA